MKLLKNWKTTLAGVLVAAITVATALHWITIEQSSMVTAALVSLGFIVAKDGNVTGGTTQQ